MSVHIFQVNEENYQICTQKGIVGLPEPKAENRLANNVFDGLLSRLAVIRENDYILMYVTKKQELRGVWQADGEPFYEETTVWPDRCYPFRCKIKCCDYNFVVPLKLNDINDLISSGKSGHGLFKEHRDRIQCFLYQTMNLKLFWKSLLSSIHSPCVKELFRNRIHLEQTILSIAFILRIISLNMNILL